MALVERKDFAAGTSSKSSKLIHGGLRYLQQGHLRLVYESVNERRLLMNLARHLVRPMPFLAVAYGGDRIGVFLTDLGCWIYEALCLFRVYELHRTLSPDQTIELEPALKRKGLQGSVHYFDCGTDDARLTLENALDASKLGATVVNHVAAVAMLKDGTGRFTGIRARDDEAEGGAEFDIRAKVVVNASGPWTDSLRALAGEGPVTKPAKGVHLVVDANRLPLNHTAVLRSPRDGRMFFAIPWGMGRTYVGTTDTFFEGSPDEVHADSGDVQYLLEGINHSFPDSKLSPDDVISTWAGLRPLLMPAGSQSASQVSREHMLFSHPGLVTITGGKLTTYRHMASEVTDAALTQLGKTAPCTTHERPLLGAVGLDSDDALGAHALKLEQLGLARDEAAHAVSALGSRAHAVIERTGDAGRGRLDAELPYLWAQVDEAVDTEFAATLDDMLSRRVPLLLRSRDQGLGVADAVAERMGQRLGWSQERKQAELESYRREVASSRAFRT